MLRELWNRWLVLARKIGNFQGRILLTLFYFLIVTPFGLLVRAFSDPLHVRPKPASDSSDWIARETHDVDLTAAHKQS